ncbi:MAG: 1-acyl-sn-glycerol-3-phosphate acyltransferase [Bacteroidetes bacterium]|nr:1-acyl-sn-glycerol-3-phosphate acyltransferase [Bacteroidota bacterium]
MLYRSVKILARLAIKLYCRKIFFTNKALFHSKGPLLLAVNHPNSFLDAIILCTLFDQPVYSLARGDAFKGKWISKILYAFKLLPVYRVSEGVENLEENYKTFDLCKEIFKKNGVVLIFSEGRCINEWHLRPLKKGTARLAISSWEDGIPLKVLPVGINYSSFRKMGKNLHLFLGNLISSTDIVSDNGHGRSIQSFNAKLLQQLQPFVFEIAPGDAAALKKQFFIPQPVLKKILLFIPSVAGWLLHAPLFIPVKSWVKKMSYDSDHYDSIIVAMLLLIYPAYLLLVTGIVLVFTHQLWYLLLLLVMPFTAWAHIQLKQQLDAA